MRLLLGDDDIDGACNRAYYAMFEAARAALTASGFDVGTVKTHASIIGQFGLRIVQTNMVPRERGHALNEAKDVRHIADYTGEPISRDDAMAMVEQAVAFVEAIRRIVAVGEDK